ncbi:hypothetical protein RHSIM_Rhsim08G0035900 [Rhododendron simsii]|uniref:Uncharacterized protein n=1 Tax=Rhododendron simsii TaxID=118357 RepID=A0A834GK71_RHOSS|nr:hypothetical protein RHSIM_Rhsim08G0035900 [Rhododendron simsii]
MEIMQGTPQDFLPDPWWTLSVLFCLREDESHPHLFFSCSFAQQVRSSNLLCNGISITIRRGFWLGLNSIDEEVALISPICVQIVFGSCHILAVEGEKWHNFSALVQGLLFSAEPYIGGHSWVYKFLEED